MTNNNYSITLKEKSIAILIRNKWSRQSKNSQLVECLFRDKKKKGIGVNVKKETGTKSGYCSKKLLE